MVDEPSSGLEPAALQAALEEVHRAGMPGVYAQVCAGEETWAGAAGVADLGTGRPVGPGMRHRVGSVTKTFTAAAVLLEDERGRIALDRPVVELLPELGLLPGDPDRDLSAVTVRMLLGHTSGFPEYLPYAFPSLMGFPSSPDLSGRSLEDNRYRSFHPDELIGMGVAAPPASAPGAAVGTYSNTNYLLLGQVLERVTGTPAEEHVTRAVIRPAGLRDTGFPSGTSVEGPHARMYEALYGLIDPPRDFSVYDMSWVSLGAGLVSTMADLNRFYALLFDGAIVSEASLAEMRRTTPVRTQEGTKTVDYGLGLHRVEMPGLGTFWGHDGTVWGAATQSLISDDGTRRLSVGMNLVRWNKPDATGRPQPHPIDGALSALYALAAGGTQEAVR